MKSISTNGGGRKKRKAKKAKLAQRRAGDVRYAARVASAGIEALAAFHG